MKLKKLNYLQRIRFKYRVSILNENTLEEAFHVRLSQLSVFLFGMLFAVLSFFIFSGLIFFTPIKHFLPGFSDATIRAELIKETIRLDSLSRSIEMQNLQLFGLKQVISGNISIDSITPIDSTKLQTYAKLSLEKEKAESKFREEYEEEEKYNLSVIETRPEEEVLVFVKPSKGVPTNTKKTVWGYGIDLATAPNEAILAVQEGTILSADYTMNSGYSICIQHSLGYISIYKNLERLLVQSGAQVRAGQAIGIAGIPNSKEAGNTIHFELWQNGKPLRAEDFIVF